KDAAERMRVREADLRTIGLGHQRNGRPRDMVMDVVVEGAADLPGHPETIARVCRRRQTVPVAAIPYLRIEGAAEIFIGRKAAARENHSAPGDDGLRSPVAIENGAGHATILRRKLPDVGRQPYRNSVLQRARRKAGD